MTTTYISTVDAKEEFAELINRVLHNHEHIILTRRDKEVAAIIPIDDLFLLQASKNKNDLDDAVEALKEARKQGTITLDQLKKELD